MAPSRLRVSRSSASFGNDSASSSARLELGAGVPADPAAVGERGQRCQCAAAAQLRMPAAGDELLGLGKELDLANAAAAKLDVVTFDRDVLVPPIGVNLALERFDVGD